MERKKEWKALERTSSPTMERKVHENGKEIIHPLKAFQHSDFKRLDFKMENRSEAPALDIGLVLFNMPDCHSGISCPDVPHPDHII